MSDAWHKHMVPSVAWWPAKKTPVGQLVDPGLLLPLQVLGLWTGEMESEDH